ncbi:MAG: hypothetical protein SGILL_003575 [Bacillariaceae sp.]
MQRQLGPISQFMINSYCESLDGFFGQMVFFGLLKEEDAQCFSVQSSIEEGAFVLAAGAVLLALLNTFVSKAVTQYIREKTMLEKQIEEQQDKASLDGMEYEKEHSDEDPAKAGGIHPVPVLFTDTFRWLLRGDTRDYSSSRAFEAQIDIPKGATPAGGSCGGGDRVDVSLRSRSADGHTELQSESWEVGEAGDADLAIVCLCKRDNGDEEIGLSTIQGTPRDSPSATVASRSRSRSVNNRPDKGDVGVL